MPDSEREEAAKQRSPTPGWPGTPGATPEFAAFAAHEFRGPIHTLQAFLGILLREQPGPLNEIQRDFLLSMLVITRRMERLTEDMQVFLVDGDHLPINRGPVDVASLVEECRRELAPIAENYNVDIESSYEMGLNQEIESDPVRLTQTIINLLENAIRHSVQGSTVWVRVRQSSNRVLLVVENEAISPPEDDIQEWFVPFVRAPSAREKAPHGLGLGLPIVSQLVAVLGGRIMTRTAGPVVTIAICLPRDLPLDVHT